MRRPPAQPPRQLPGPICYVHRTLISRSGECSSCRVEQLADAIRIVGIVGILVALGLVAVFYASG